MNYRAWSTSLTGVVVWASLLIHGGAGAGTPGEGGLTVTLEVVEEIAPPGQQLWRADVVVQCGPQGHCEHARTELRYAKPGGSSALVPVSESGTPSSEVPLVVPLTARNREIVVALYDTTNELRVLQHAGGGTAELMVQADLPVRIEALGAGDVDGDGLEDIVIGLDEVNAPQLRVFDFNHHTGALVPTIVSGILPSHVEGLKVGDADNDGQNEIVVGLEFGDEVFSRVRLYELEDGEWQETLISAPGSLHCQDVEIGDVDGDGQNEIVASMANGGGAGPTQIRLFRKVGSEWIPENATPLQPGRSAERLIVADADGDGDQEIVTAYWDPQVTSITRLVVIDNDDGVWNETTIDSGFIVDGLAVGDLDGDARPDVLSGEALNPSGFVRGYEWNTESEIWELTWITAPIGTVRDVDLGDYDDDGTNEVVIANNQLVRGAEADQALSTLGSFSVTVDSALVSDVDHDEPGNPRVCALSRTGSCTETFLLLSGPNSIAGTWEITARATEMNGVATAVSAGVVVETVGVPIGPGGQIPNGGDGQQQPLRLVALPGDLVRLSWAPSCRSDDVDFALYEGEIGSPESLVPVTCSTSGQLEWELSPAFERSFFVVVPTDGATEGSYGEASAGPRPPSALPCLPQLLGSPVCP